MGELRWERIIEQKKVSGICSREILFPTREGFLDLVPLRVSRVNLRRWGRSIMVRGNRRTTNIEKQHLSPHGYHRPCRVPWLLKETLKGTTFKLRLKIGKHLPTGKTWRGCRKQIQKYVNNMYPFFQSIIIKCVCPQAQCQVEGYRDEKDPLPTLT